jgi:anti-sigma regulatory factor (Ser/Thr protein kinase)
MIRPCRARVAPDFANLDTLERFVLACPLLDVGERNRALLVVTEYFDNIVMHGKCPQGSLVSVRISRARAGKAANGGTVRILISYRSPTFARMVASHGTARPYFDAASRRYRGLGLLMCRNIAKDVSYRKGLFKGSIRIIL